MSRRNRWLPAALRQTQSTIRLNVQSLEDRVNPSEFVGPLTAEQVQFRTLYALDAYRVLSDVPPSPSGAASYLELSAFAPFTINSATLTSRLEEAPPESSPSSVMLAIPRPDGGFARFRVWEAEIMAPGLAAQHPDIRTYRGQGIDDPAATLAADVTMHGFHAQVLSPHGSYYIDPYYHLDTSVYVSYFTHDNLRSPSGCNCALCLSMLGGGNGSGALDDGGFEIQGPNVNFGTQLRTIRTAVAATGEYTTFHGGTVAAGQAAIVTSVNRVSGVYEKEVAVRLQLIANNTSIVYTNASTDPYTNTDGVAMLSQNQTNLDSVIGNANYDLGHVFSTGGGGVAGLGVVGITGQKARGVTGSSSPVGDSFDIDYVAHEMGHQFGANHSFNGPNAGSNRNASTAWEPGSGSTIMSYAGIMGSDNIQLNSDAYFHIGNIGEIRSFLATISSVGTTTPTGNSVPTANAGPDYTIPANTPFALTGSGTDADGDPLTYTWEQYDLGPATALGTYSATAPLFRSLPGTSNPVRTFPNLTNLLNNTSSKAEVMPTGARTLNFTLSVRDNKSGGGGVRSDDTVITVAASAGFLVTAPNTAVSWAGGTTQTVTWNVAGTNAAPINTSLVNILLSTDGGNTFPTVLVANTPNDGSESIVVPNTPTTKARIRVQPVNNIYFDISNVNFTITAGSAMQVTSTVPAVGGVLSGPTATLDLIFSEAINAATLTASDLSVSVGTVTGVTMPNANTARFTISSLNSEGTLTATMAAGAVTSTLGNSSGAFNGSYGVDISTIPFGGTFTATAPIGSRAYSGSMPGTVHFSSDTDSFTLDLDAGQTIAAIVTPAAGLQPRVNVIGPGGVSGSASASAAGKAAVLNATQAPQAGTYTFTVDALAGTTGTYSLQVLLNSAIETEPFTAVTNGTTAKAQDIAAAFNPLGDGASYTSVRGTLANDVGAASSFPETEPNNTAATGNNMAAAFNVYSGNVFHMGLSGTLPTATENDYFNIGVLQAGDIISIAEYGASSSRGVSTDPFVYLYNSAGTIVAQNDDGGVGTNLGDSLIWRFTIPANDTYYIRASQHSSVSTPGSYQLGIFLENTGPAPLTGGTTFTETEPNDSIAAANNVANSWQAVQAISNVTGTISSGDTDFFLYNFAAGDLVSFTVRPTGASTADLKLRLTTSTGTQLAIEDGTSDGPGLESYVFSYRIATAGTYGVEVTRAAGSGAYALDLYLSSNTPPTIPTDMYAIPLAAGQRLSLGLEATLPGTYTLDLVNAGGSTLASSAAFNNYDGAIASYTAPSAATVYARITGTSLSDYLLTAAINATLDLEPNDSFASAASLGSNARALGALTGNDDWYSVDLPAGNFIFSTLTPGGGPGQFVNTLNPRVELYSPSNVFLVGDSNSALDGINAKLNTTITVPGVYRVRVMAEAGTSGEYELAYGSGTVLGVSDFTVNGGDPQRSRLMSIRVEFTGTVSPAQFAAVGAITLTRVVATPSGSVGTVVQTGATDANGLILVTQPGPSNTIDLTFTNANGSFITSGVEYGSLADGRWQLAIPSVGFTSALDDSRLRRLFGDGNGDGIVDGIDFGTFGGFFAGSMAMYDFDANGTLDATDFANFGARFGLTL